MKKTLFVIALGVLALFGYNEYQKFKMYSVIQTGEKSAYVPSNAEVKDIPTTSFEIKSFNPRWDDGRLRAVGEIKNIGKIAAGVHVEVIARDEKGDLVDSVDFWPNSVDNIAPGASCGIAYTITRNPRAKSTEIKVIGTNVW